MFFTWFGGMFQIEIRKKRVIQNKIEKNKKQNCIHLHLNLNFILLKKYKTFCFYWILFFTSLKFDFDRSIYHNVCDSSKCQIFARKPWRSCNTYTYAQTHTNTILYVNVKLYTYFCRSWMKRLHSQFYTQLHVVVFFSPPSSSSSFTFKRDMK